MTVNFILPIIAVFIYGLCIGSFLNVCICRVPKGESIVSPPSSCPSCGNKIRFYDNIPVISYLLLQGKCRNCQNSISLQYPVTELATGILAIMVYLKFGLTLESLIYFSFMSTLLVISVIDMELQIIPNVISLPGIPVFLIASFFLPGISPTDSIAGILLGGGSLYAVAIIYTWIKKQQGMGGGDIKLLAMIGPIVGWKGILFTIFAGSLTGTVGGVALMAASRMMNMQLKIPFGPFLSLGACLYIFWGDQIINWYISLIIGH